MSYVDRPVRRRGFCDFVDEEGLKNLRRRGKDLGKRPARGRPSVRLGGVDRQAVAGCDARTRNPIPGPQRADARPERTRNRRESVATLGMMR